MTCPICHRPEVETERIENDRVIFRRPKCECDMPSKNEVTIFAEEKYRTENAILFTDGVDDFWLPLSMIHLESKGGNNFEVSMPEWLAKKKEII
jgi:hypothetical protein